MPHEKFHCTDTLLSQIDATHWVSKVTRKAGRHAERSVLTSSCLLFTKAVEMASLRVFKHAELLLQDPKLPVDFSLSTLLSLVLPVLKIHWRKQPWDHMLLYLHVITLVYWDHGRAGSCLLKEICNLEAHADKRSQVSKWPHFCSQVQIHWIITIIIKVSPSMGHFG